MDPLTALHPLRLPAASPWPLAPGWWALIAASLLLTVLAWGYYRYRQRTALRRWALRHYQHLWQQYQQQPQHWLSEVNALLKRLLRHQGQAHLCCDLPALQQYVSAQWTDAQDDPSTPLAQALILGHYRLPEYSTPQLMQQLYPRVQQLIKRIT